MNDLISREDALNFEMNLEAKNEQEMIGVVRGMQIYADHIKSLPGVGWVSVKERLPEEDVEVLISYRYKEGEGDTSHVNVDITSYGPMYFGGREVAGVKHWRPMFEYFSSNYEVIAWMPLPEPYNGESED